MGVTRKKNIRAGNKTTRRDAQKKARPAKAMAVSVRDVVKKLPIKASIIKERSVLHINPDLHINPEHSGTPSCGKASAPNKKPVTTGREGAVELAAIVAKENASPSMFASQMQLFTTLLKWSPLSMFIRQQALVTGMVFNLRYPTKSELT